MKKCKHSWYYLGYLEESASLNGRDLFWCKICGTIRREGWIGTRENQHLEARKHKLALFFDAQQVDFYRPKAARDTEIEWHRWALENFKGVAKRFAEYKCWQWGGNTEEEGCGYCPPCQLDWALDQMEED